MKIISKTSQLIHCELSTNHMVKLHISFIYASNSVDDRFCLWEDLRQLSASIRDACCLMGDFNVILNPTEVHYPGKSITYDKSMSDLESLFHDLHLVDHPAIGYFHTWSNRRIEDFQCRKLDRVVVNKAWFNLPSFSRVSFEEPQISYHASVVPKIACQENSGPKPFKYFNHWSMYRNFLSVMEETWAIPNHLPPMISLFDRLKKLGGPLKELGKEDKEHLNKKAELKCKLKDVQ